MVVHISSPATHREEQYEKMEPKYPEGGPCQIVLHPQRVFNVPPFLINSVDIINQLKTCNTENSLYQILCVCVCVCVHVCAICLQSLNENKGDQVVGFIGCQNTAGGRRFVSSSGGIPPLSAAKMFQRDMNRQYTLISQCVIAEGA